MNGSIRKATKLKRVFALGAALTLALTLIAGCDRSGAQDQEPLDLHVYSGGQTGGGEQASPGAQGHAGGQQGAEPPADSNVMVIMGRTVPASTPEPEDTLPWPSDAFPAGFPAYPHGDVIMADRDESGFFVYVDGTDRQGYDGYISTLEANGWNFVETGDDTWAMASKADLLLILIYYGDGVGILIDEFDLDEFYPDHDWPTDLLPSGFPAYHGGRIWFVNEWDDGDSVMLSIMETDRGAFNAYISALEAEGWSFDDDWNAFLGFYYLSVTFEEPDGVNIMLFKCDFDFSDDGSGDLFGREWPDDLPFYLPEYTDGVIASATTGGAGISIRIENSSRRAYESYIDTLISLGYKPDNPADLYPDMGILWYDEDAFQHILLSIDADGTTVGILVVPGYRN